MSTFAAFKSPRNRQPVSADETQSIVEKLARVAPPLIQSTSRARGIDLDTKVDGAYVACTLMSRLAYDVLGRFGIEGQPVDTLVTCWNAAAEVWRTTGVDQPGVYWRSNDPDVIAQEGPITTHLVIVVPAVSMLVDLSAWQLSHHERQLKLPRALALPWTGDEAGYGCATGYVRYRRDTSPHLLPMEQRADWSENWSLRMKPLTKVIAARVRG